MEPNRADLGDSQCKTPGGVFADGRKHLLALELCHRELFAGRSWLLRALSDRVSPWTDRKSWATDNRARNGGAAGWRRNSSFRLMGSTRLMPLSQVSTNVLEERVASLLQAYDAQGNHRTGTEIDCASAQWLADHIRRFGIEPSLEPFALSRVDPQLTYARIEDRRIDGIPMFDAAFTTADGVRGRLGPLGSDTDIGLAESSPATVTQTAEADIVPAARRSRHKAVILVTGGGKPGLFLSNASAFPGPVGPPMLQISSVEGAWLRQQAQHRAEATVVAYVRRTPAHALNVIATIAGRDQSLAPLVVMAPRSGWWQCVSEQGSRLVCWLEIMRVLAGARPARDCHFVALSGHELAFMGMNPYLDRRQGLITRAEAWIFLGSDIGAPRQPNLIHASDHRLEQWVATALAKQGLPVDAKEQHSSRARGETAAIQRGGGRFVTLACGSSVFHNVADRWPEAVDVSLLARYATALADGAKLLAEHGAQGGDESQMG